MTVANTIAAETWTLVLHMPDLSAESFMGAGCCVVSADDALRRELQSWPGVVNVDIDPATGRAIVIVTRDRPDPADLLEAVESMGFPATLVGKSSNGSGGR